ncbi:MAG: hypothetical protein ACK5O2_12110 [Microthrixaceae bacterium]
MSYAIASPAKPKPKGALIAALVFLVLGIAGCGYGAAKIVPFFSDAVEFFTDLDQVARVTPMGEPITFTSAGTDGIALLSGEAVCTGESAGGDVRFQPYESFGSTTSFELGGVSMDGYILFSTESGSEYTITCGSAGSGSYVATTAPNFLIDGATGLATGFGAGLFGGFCILVAIILLIVGLVQRSGWKKRNQGFQGGPPPGMPGQPAQVPPAPGQGAWGPQGPGQGPAGAQPVTAPPPLGTPPPPAGGQGGPPGTPPPFTGSIPPVAPPTPGGPSTTPPAPGGPTAGGASEPPPTLR